MRAGTANSRSASWLAILVMVCNTLWPLVANARPASAVPMVEICTAHGTKKVPDVAGGPVVSGDPITAPGKSGGMPAQSHCAHCCCDAAKASALTGAAFHSAYEAAAFCESVAGYGLLHSAGDTRSPAYPRAPPVRS
jgi:hypothetical protein